MERIEGQIIDEKDIIDITPEQPKKKCKTCSQKLSKTSWGMIILSSYILFSSIYVTIKLFKEIIHLF